MASNFDPEFVRIVEVGPRDGLQNIKATVATSTKLELIKRLHQTGLPSIEITSIVSAKAVPQLSDCQTVLSDPNIQSLLNDSRIRAPVLIPNERGLKIALAHGVKEVAVFISASEGFSRANINCSVQQGLERARLVAQNARQNQLSIRGYVIALEKVSLLRLTNDSFSSLAMFPVYSPVPLMA